MESNCHYQEVLLPAGGTALLQIPNAVFLRCIGAEGWKFLLSIDGDQAVPCWAGWNWKTQGEPIQRLLLKSLPGETRDLTIGFFYGDGDHQLSGTSLTQHFQASRLIEEKIPSKIFPVRFMSDDPDDSVIHWLQGEDLYFSYYWYGWTTHATYSLAGSFDKFGITLVKNDPINPVMLTYFSPGSSSFDPGIPVPIDGETMIGESSLPIRLGWEFLDSSTWTIPKMSFSIWRSNPLFEEPVTVSYDSLLFEFYYEPWPEVNEQPETAWFMNGEEVPLPEIIGLGSKGLRHTRASFRGAPGWDAPRQTLFRIREYYECTGGSEPLTLELRARRNPDRPDKSVPFMVGLRPYRDSVWTMPRTETVDRFNLVSGTALGESYRYYEMETDWKPIFEFRFNPRNGAVVTSWK